jgi:hypothetical protein
MKRVYRLYVVVTIEENGRPAGSMEPIAVDHRVTGRVHEANILETHATQLIGGPLGASAHVGRMLKKRADAGNGEELLQLLHVAIAVDVDEVDNISHTNIIAVRVIPDRSAGSCSCHFQVASLIAVIGAMVGSYYR